MRKVFNAMRCLLYSRRRISPGGGGPRVQRLGRPVMDEIREILGEAAGRPFTMYRVDAQLRGVRMLPSLNLVHILNESGVVFGIEAEGTRSLNLHMLGEFVVKGSIGLHLFTEREERRLRELLPLVEDEVGEVVYPFSPATPFSIRIGPKPVGDWDRGMRDDQIEWYERVIYPAILNEMEQLTLPSGAVVCEPACSTGDLLKHIARRFPHVILYGSDVSREVVELARAENSSIAIYHSDAAKLDYLDNESVDLFVCSGLLGIQVVALEKGQQIIQAMRRKLKPKGKVIVYGWSSPIFSRKEYKGFGYRVLKGAKWQADFFVPFYVLEKA